MTGGIGSGKTTVAALFAKWGADLIDADRVAHQVLARPGIRRRLVARWGRGIAPKGEIDRNALARVAFRDEDSVRELNSLLHPAIGAEIRRRIRKSRSRFVVLDAPLLFEAGADRACDWVVFVDLPTRDRLGRIRERGWGPRELIRRERFQWPAAVRRTGADFVVDNRGTRSAVARHVRAIYRKIMESHL